MIISLQSHINDDYEVDSLIYDPNSSNKKQEVYNVVKDKILKKEITNNIDGLKFVLSHGCEPKLFVDVVENLINQQEITIEGNFNRTASNIHKAAKYQIISK